MNDETNNQILSNMAGVEPNTKTNNQLLKELSLNEEADDASDVKTVNGKTGPDINLTAGDVGAVEIPVGLGSSQVIGTHLSNNDITQVPYSQDETGFNLVMRDIEGKIPGLTNVDDTSDADKPVSAAQQTALDGKLSVGGDAPSGQLEFGTTNHQGFTILLDGNPFIVVNDIGNMSINTGSAPSVPFLVGGGLFTSAGPVFAQINPDSGSDLSMGTTSNHPVNLIANGTTTLTLNGDGSTTSAGDLHMSEKKVINIANGSDARDAVNFQQLETKRTVSSGNNLVYVTDGTGTQTTLVYAPSAATPNTIVQRGADGTITANPPTAELHVATKAWTEARALTQAAVTAVGSLSTIATADATDPATTMALVNECKAKINSIISALQAS